MVAVKSFKYHKDLVSIFIVETDTIVTYGDPVIVTIHLPIVVERQFLLPLFFRRDMNFRCHRFFPEFERIADQVVK